MSSITLECPTTDGPSGMSLASLQYLAKINGWTVEAYIHWCLAQYHGHYTQEELDLLEEGVRQGTVYRQPELVQLRALFDREIPEDSQRMDAIFGPGRKYRWR